jgi:hypothetical protein
MAAPARLITLNIGSQTKASHSEYKGENAFQGVVHGARIAPDSFLDCRMTDDPGMM